MYYSEEEARMINSMVTASGSYEYRRHTYENEEDRLLNQEFDDFLDDSADLYLRIFGTPIF